MGDLLRTVILRARDEEFILKMWDTGRIDDRGQTIIGYSLRGRDHRAVFEGRDFSGSPLHADDSDETVKALVTFLTLKPGDTDAEYFEFYTPTQMAFAQGPAEELSLYTLEDAELEDA